MRNQRRHRTAAAVLLTTVLFFAAWSASAVTFSTVGPTTRTAAVGDLITVEFNVHNAAGPGSGSEGVLSVQASASGFGGTDLTGLQLVSGQSSAFYFADLCISPTVCLGGLFGFSGTVDPGNLTQEASGNVSVIDASENFPIFNEGFLDVGYDGTSSSSDVTLTFLVTGAVNGLELGTQLSGDTIVTPNGNFDANSAAYTINVIPEPGVALLLGIGLAGLAGHRNAAGTGKQVG